MTLSCGHETQLVFVVNGGNLQRHERVVHYLTQESTNNMYKLVINFSLKYMWRVKIETTVTLTSVLKVLYSTQ